MQDKGSQTTGSACGNMRPSLSPTSSSSSTTTIPYSTSSSCTDILIIIIISCSGWTSPRCERTQADVVSRQQSRSLVQHCTVTNNPGLIRASFHVSIAYTQCLFHYCYCTIEKACFFTAILCLMYV